MTPSKPPFPIYQVPVILASQSPRRIELISQLGLPFSVCTVGDVEEVYPPDLVREEIPLYLARLKADAFLQQNDIPDNTVLITADTIVWLHDRVLGKPDGRNEAIEMLLSLSGNMHQVYTGVCLSGKNKSCTFYAESKVFFRTLDEQEIVYYVDNYQPFDKAGAYGIQEWIGYVGIERIEGSYYNVMGLPVQRLYHELRNFI